MLAARCATPPRRRRSGGTLQAGTFSVVLLGSRALSLRRDGQARRRAATPRSRRSPTACRGSSCACRCCFPKGSNKGRITLQQFVALSATNAARLYGLHRTRARIAIGADADIAIWDPQEARRRHGRGSARRHGLHPVRGHGADRLAGHGADPRARVIDRAEAGGQTRATARSSRAGRIDLTGLPAPRCRRLDPATNFGA